MKFTPEQQALIWAARNRFNISQQALATRIVANAEMTGNASVIPLDAWRRIDQRAQAIARSRLAVFSRLFAANSTPVSIAELVNYYPIVSDSNEVVVSMDGRVQAKGDQATVRFAGTPVPIMTTSNSFGWRQYAVMTRGGGQIDTASFANGDRKLAEFLENMALNGLSSVNVAGDTIYGLRNFPSRFTGNHTFTLTSATGANWVTAINQGLAGLESRNQFGPVTIFVNQGDYRSAGTRDYSTSYSGTILERVLAIPGVQELVPASSVPANELIFVSDLASGEWGTVLNGMPPTTRPKTRLDPEDDYKFTKIAAQSLQLRADASGQSAIAHIVQ